MKRSRGVTGELWHRANGRLAAYEELMRRDNREYHHREMITRIRLPKRRINALCRKYGVAELAVFGSATRQDFSRESDVDLLVTFDSDDLGPWMGRLTGLQEELEKLLGRKVDLVLKKNLKWVIRDRVLESAKVVYTPR